MARAKTTGKAKVTAKAKARPNGVHKVPSTPTPSKTPTQPAELSEQDRQNVKSWLDRQERTPFSLFVEPASKKRKRGSNALQLQTDIFDPRLDVHYEVRPRDKWESLRRYKKFTVGSESIAVNQCILVKHDDSEDAKIDIPAQWKAKVLEVRALDSEHVYIRVAWLNRPEDLTGGRKPYHGKNELIPTNQMDVIDAMAVNGTVDVEYWDEKDDDSALLNEDKYFWRQTLDYVGSKSLSKLREICVDNAPQNPDEMIMQCGNEECRQWMHVKCIAEAAVEEAADDSAPSAKRQKTERPKAVMIEAQSSALARAEKNAFAAEVFIKNLPQGEERKASEATEIVITRPDDEQERRNMKCLFCKTDIE